MAASLDLDESYRMFEQRYLENKARPRIDNTKLPAGSPIHYDCAGCYADMERDEDDFGEKKKHCKDCEPLHEAGILFGFVMKLEKQAQ